MKLHHHAKIIYRPGRIITLPQFHMFLAFKEGGQGIRWHSVLELGSTCDDDQDQK